MSYTNVVFKQHIARNVNKDEIQHQRIDDRSIFRLIHSAFSQDSKQQELSFSSPLSNLPQTSPHQRFNKNHDINDRIKRQNDKQKQQNFYNARLQKRLERDDDKWKKESEKMIKQQEKRVYHQKILIDNKKNSNGLGYNPITHAYQESSRGQVLKNYDEGKEVNRYVRSKNIIQKNNAGFNIITGQNKALVHQQIPETIKARVEKKYEQKKERQAVKYVPKRDKYDYLDDQP